MTLIIKNKRGAVGSTLTWIAATFIIFFILAIYFVFLTIIYETKNIAGEDISISYAKTDTSNVKFLLNFLKSDAENGESVYDYLSTANIKDAEKIKFFSEKGKALLWKIFPEGTDNNPKYNSWMRLYYLNETEEQYPSGLSEKYTFDVAQFARRSSEYCIPKENNLIVIPIAPDKKIALCWQKHEL